MQDLRANWIISEVLNAWELMDRAFPGSNAQPDGTGGGGRETWSNIAQIALIRAYGENRATSALQLDYHASKVLAETDPEELRFLLINLAVTALDWIYKLDSEKAAQQPVPVGVLMSAEQPSRLAPEKLISAQPVFSNGAAFVPYPADKSPRYNGSGTPCDMWVGPCSCGAWHHGGVDSLEQSVRK